ncbi:MAG: DUF5662 family protein [Dehalococcoidia bacterium]|jgi:hypothetical protein
MYTVDELKTNTETQKHINNVVRFMTELLEEIKLRCADHDKSKFERPEVEIFTVYTPKLAGCTYGSDEYKSYLSGMKPALDHHYNHNRHHPEHFANGIDGMTLVDLIEMLCDWKAATMRHNDGSMDQSLEINKARFGMSDQLVSMLRNTVEGMDWRS